MTTQDWMMTFTGKRIFPFAVKPEEIDLEDIAHSLSMQVRYNGHVRKFYSVGEHCIHIASALWRDTKDPLIAMCGLLHDAGETYTGDFIRPVKNSLHQVEEVLKRAEKHNEASIAEHFGLPNPLPAIVKEYDKRIIVDEKTALFGKNKPWDWDYEPLGVTIENWLPDEGRDLYHRAFNLLVERGAWL